MLNRIALRIATVRALRGKTYAQDKVFDSVNAAIDDVAAEHPTPVIAVYTDGAHYSPGGKSLYAVGGDGRVGSGQQTLTIEIALTQRMVVPTEDGQSQEVVLPLFLDPALELMLDLIERQVADALMSPAEDDVWADMWNRLALGVDRSSERGMSQRDGVRFAGRQITLGISLPTDPIPGMVNPLWDHFMTLVAGEPDLAVIVPMLTRARGGTAPEPGAVRQFFGLTVAENAALGLAEPVATGVAP